MFCTAEASIVAAALLVGAVIGGWLARVRTTKTPSPSEAGGAPDSDAPEDAVRAGTSGRSAKAADVPTRAKDPFAGFPCRLGDVVLAHDGEESWLESALVLYEEAPVLVLFSAPNMGGDRALLARRAPHDDLIWLTAAVSLEWGPSEEPPSSLLHGGDWYERLRRLPLEAEALGPSALAAAGTVLFAEYKSSADRRLIVLLGSGRVLAWEGRVLARGMYEVLPGGGGGGAGAAGGGRE